MAGGFLIERTDMSQVIAPSFEVTTSNFQEAFLQLSNAKLDEYGHGGSTSRTASSEEWERSPASGFQGIKPVLRGQLDPS